LKIPVVITFKCKKLKVKQLRNPASMDSNVLTALLMSRFYETGILSIFQSGEIPGITHAGD
jgi:hypothetical protein